LSEDLLREHAAEALFQIGEPAVKPLIAALRKPEGPNTPVTEAVPQVDEGEKVAGDVGGTSTDGGQAPNVPGIAVSHDGETDSPSPSAPEMAEDTTWKIRKAAAWTLGMLRDRRAVEPLLTTLNDIGSVRVSVIEALGRLEAPEAAEPLVRLMKTDPALRKLTAGSLVLVGEEAIPVVKELLRAPDPDLQAYARYILEGIGRRIQEADEEEEGGPPMDMVLNEM
jgi:HEAT repeat protein